MKPHVYSTFIYATIITLMAFIIRNPKWLIMTSVISIVICLIYGGRRILYLILLVSIGFIGVFVNALFFANTGEVVVETGPIIIRKHALEEFLVVALRLLLIASGGGVLALTHSSSEIARGLARELGLPYYIALPIFYALRSLPLIKQDLDEILFMRKQRGYGRIPISPGSISSIITPLLSISYQRALWGGISAELKGLRGSTIYRRIEVNILDILLLILLMIYIVTAFIPG
ncbi:energy-coupling factor transporter transmembrane component T [Desulfurococcus amylolyticus]|uniref:Cobalt transport protein n=1 Tax=Desulfurococcus amylolyticus DSM 16532 TaxID=768672 RepID=I3XQ73_DESAM|nr:energy-coupling factor transporter transmembrane component T [Desulfurococcus amylolyticus]AFL66097.1 cobalt transport protein [Desulfurococcus amylolyticus DSM 16532]